MSKETRAFQLVPGSNDKERTEIAIRHINTVSKSLYNQAEIEQLRDIVLNHIASPYIFNASYLTNGFTTIFESNLLFADLLLYATK